MNYKKDVIKNLLMCVWSNIFCLALIAVDIKFYYYFLSKNLENLRNSIIIFYSILFLRNNFLNVLGCLERPKCVILNM